MSNKSEALAQLANHPSTPPNERAAAVAALVALANGGGAEGRAIEQVSAARELAIVREKMPAWIEPKPTTGDARYFPPPDGGGPHDRDVRAFAKRMLRSGYCYHTSNYSADWHDAMRGYSAERRGRGYMMWHREEFEFEQFADDVTKISVLLAGERYAIYEKDGGWRLGPWWPRLLDLFQRWMAEADAIDAQRAAERAEEERKSKAKDDALFTDYLRRQ